jgi:hypothetical protein
MSAPAHATNAKQNQKEATRSAEELELNKESTPSVSAWPSLLSLHRIVGNRAFGQTLQAHFRSPSSKSHESRSSSSDLGVGQPLDAGTLAFMESRFQHDFGDVRLHTGPKAHKSAMEYGAKAYTVGNHITFGKGRYSPHTLAGKQLIAHELAHVIQQSRNGPEPPLDGKASHESSAHDAATLAISTEGPITVSGATGIGVAREADDELNFDEAFKESPGTVSATTGTAGKRDPGDFSLQLAKKEKKLRDLRKEFRGVPTRKQADQFGKLHSEYNAQVKADEKKKWSTAAASPGSMARPGPSTPGHQRGHSGEQSAAFAMYRAEDGWTILRGPSGTSAEGHGTTSTGEDILAYNVRTGELDIVDNKSYKRKGNVSEATAIQRDKTLPKNIDNMIAYVKGKSLEDLPMRQDVLRRLRQAKAAVRDGRPMPARVSLVVTHAESRTTGVTQRLRNQGISSRRIDAPTSRPGTTRPPFIGRAQKQSTPTLHSGLAGSGKVAASGKPGGAAQLQSLKTTKLPDGIQKTPAVAKPPIAVAPPTTRPVQKVPPTLAKPVAGDKDGANNGGVGRSIEFSRKPTLTAGPGKAGVGGSAGVGASQSHGRGVTTSQSLSADGNVTVNVAEEPGTSPIRYRVTLQVSLGAGANLGIGREGSVGGSGSLSASGKVFVTRSHLFSAEEAEAYVGAAKSGSGGKYEELQIVSLIAKGGSAEARKLINQMNSVGGTDTLAEGEEVSYGGTAQGGGAIGASRSRGGGKGLGVQLGVTQRGSIQVTRSLKDGKEYFSFSITTEKEGSLGASGGFGVGTMGITGTAGESKGSSVMFVLDPKTPNYVAGRKEIEAVSTVEGLRQLAARRKDAASVTTSQGKSQGLTTEAGVLGFGLRFADQGSFTEQETVSAEGVTRQYEGKSDSGAALTVGGKPFVSFGKEDAFTGGAGPGNRGFGETKSTTRETDFGRTVEKFGDQPLQKLAALVTGGQVLEQRVDSEGKALSDESYSRIIELANDPRTWSKQFDVRGGVNRSFLDWVRTGAKIRSANGDRALVARALAEFESGGTGRSASVEKAVGKAGIGFEFPEEIKDQKPFYDRLIVNDPLAHARELEAQGRKSDASSEAKKALDDVEKLRKSIEKHTSVISNPTILDEMMGRIAQRQTLLRGEYRRLSAATEAHPVVKEDQEKSVQEDRNAEIGSLLSACVANQSKESQLFGEIDKEYDRTVKTFLGSFDFGKADVIKVIEVLTQIKGFYPGWDEKVAKLKDLYRKNGQDPALADRYAPNRARYDVLYARANKWPG